MDKESPLFESNSPRAETGNRNEKSFELDRRGRRECPGLGCSQEKANAMLEKRGMEEEKDLHFSFFIDRELLQSDQSGVTYKLTLMALVSNLKRIADPKDLVHDMLP